MESADQLNTSSASLYGYFTGKEKEITPQSVMLWVNVADVGTAHVLAIVRISSRWLLCRCNAALQDAPDAGNHRFLICGDQPYNNKQISDAFIKNYPEIASRVPTKLPGGVDENGFPADGYFTGDNSLSKKLLGITYQNFEDTMVQYADSVKDLPSTAP
jgi:hypothetical protein